MDRTEKLPDWLISEVSYVGGYYPIHVTGWNFCASGWGEEFRWNVTDARGDRYTLAAGARIDHRCTPYLAHVPDQVFQLFLIESQNWSKGNVPDDVREKLEAAHPILCARRWLPHGADQLERFNREDRFPDRVWAALQLAIRWCSPRFSSAEQDHFYMGRGRRAYYRKINRVRRAFGVAPLDLSVFPDCR